MTDVALAIRAQMDAQEATSGLADIGDAASSMADEVQGSADTAADAAAQLGDLASSSKDVTSNFKQASGSINAVAGGLDAVGLSGASDALKEVSTVTSTLAGVGKGFNLVLKSQYVQSLLVKTGLIAQTAATEAQTVATEGSTGAQWALNAALEANPIGLIVLAIVALVAGLIIAYKKSETFRNIVNAAFESVSKVVGVVVAFIKDHWKLLFVILTGPVGLAVLLIAKHWDKIKDGGAAVVDWVKDHFSDVKDAVTKPFSDAKAVVSDIWDRITGVISGAKTEISTDLGAVKSAVQDIVDAFQAVIDKVGDVIQKIKDIPHPDLPGFLGGRAAAGSGGLGGLGLAAALPGSFGSKGGDLHVTVNGFVGNEVQLATQLQRIVSDQVRRQRGPVR